MQQLAWLVWIHTDETATEQDFEGAYQDIIDQNTPLFEKQTESLTAYQMNFLRAVLEGVHREFTTRTVLQKYKLGSSANVSIVKRALLKKELIEMEKRQVVIPDRDGGMVEARAGFVMPNWGRRALCTVR